MQLEVQQLFQSFEKHMTERIAERIDAKMSAISDDIDSRVNAALANHHRALSAMLRGESAGTPDVPDGVDI